MPTDTFATRVQELVSAGKLTAEEAAELLRGAPPEPDPAPIPEAPTTAAADAPPRLFVELAAATISIRGRPDVIEPRLVHANRGINLRATSQGWVLANRPVPDLPSALDWVRAGLSTLAPGDVELEVPEAFTELDLRVLSGDIDVRDVRAHVRILLTAGDVDLDRVGGFDVTARTGSVRVRARVAEGRHRVQALTGDAELVLDPGSSAELELSTLFGRVDAPRLKLDRRGAGARTCDAKVGDGTARIRVETVAGDIDVRTPLEA